MKSFYLACLLILLSIDRSDAQIFKCKDKAGKTAFQESPCSNSIEQQTIRIQKGPSKKAIETANLINERITTAGKNYANSEKNKTERVDLATKDNCGSIISKYEAEKARIVAQCKRRRDTYCDKSPEEILQIQDMNWLTTASIHQERMYQKNARTRTPFINELLKDLKKHNCNFQK